MSEVTSCTTTCHNVQLRGPGPSRPPPWGCPRPPLCLCVLHREACAELQTGSERPRRQKPARVPDALVPHGSPRGPVLFPPLHPTHPSTFPSWATAAARLADSRVAVPKAIRRDRALSHLTD